MPDGASPGFLAVDRRLREILDPYRSRLSVTKDGPGGLALEIPGLEGKPWGYVAGVRPGKRYVSFYLMALYASPELAPSMSPGLRRRMQGKSCFNFTTIDESLFEELAALMGASLDPHLRKVAEIANVKTPARSR
jgi:hypothetical protein